MARHPLLEKPTIFDGRKKGHEDSDIDLNSPSRDLKAIFPAARSLAPAVIRRTIKMRCGPQVRNFFSSSFWSQKLAHTTTQAPTHVLVKFQALYEEKLVSILVRTTKDIED
jgi:hypothetical protein